LSPDIKALRILTAYEKGKQRAWVSRVEIAQPLLDAWKANRGKSLSLLQNLKHNVTWAWWLYRESPKYDIVYAGSDWVGLFFAIGQRLLRTRRVPHIFIDFYLNIQEQGMSREIRRWLYRLAAQGASRVVVQRSCEVDNYAKILGIPREKFVLIPYHPTLYDTRYSISDGDYIFAGGDSDRDYPLLIEAVRGLPYRVVIACLRRDHFAGVDIPENVEICKVPEAEFLQLMAGARLNVVPLKWLPQHVGGEQTYLNAMTMGKATIVTDAQACDYIESGVTGILTAAGDVPGLRAAIQQLMENPEMARIMGARAKVAAESFKPEKFFEAIFRISEECVGQGRVGGRKSAVQEEAV
jgi:glycosyltransferase involved in cell wall biosynthesis